MGHAANDCIMHRQFLLLRLGPLVSQNQMQTISSGSVSAASIQVGRHKAGPSMEQSSETEGQCVAHVVPTHMLEGNTPSLYAQTTAQLLRYQISPINRLVF